jgi:dTDP-4-dehydrorhamnose 3,5-epimerase
MRFDATDIDGVVIITPEKHIDGRGFFSRIYCVEEFERAGIAFNARQINLSRNTSARTLRGMHYQDPPVAEAKLVRVVRGSLQDVVIDLRAESRSFQSWISVTLDSEDDRALFIPEGCAHGFLTLEADTDVLYQMGRAHVPGHAKGIRYDDSAFAIEWRATPLVISDDDRSWPDWKNKQSNVRAKDRG